MPALTRVLAVLAAAVAVARAQDVVRLSVGDERWAGFVALRARLGLPSKDCAGAAPALPQDVRNAMRAVREGLRASRGAEVAAEGGPPGAKAALRRAAIDRAFHAAVAADPVAVPALLALATTSPDDDQVLAALAIAGADPLASCRADEVEALFEALCEQGTEPVQRLAFAGLLECTERGPLSAAMLARSAAIAAADLPAAVDLQTDPQSARARHPIEALPNRAFGAPLTADARRVALASLAGDGALVRRLATCGADARFVLQCHMLAAQNCTAETARELFAWYSPHVATWDPAKQPGFNAWQLGILDLLVAVYPQLAAEQQRWFECLERPSVAPAARHVLRRHWRRCSARGGFAGLDGITGLCLADGLRLYGKLAHAAPWTLTACVAGAPVDPAERVRFLRFALVQAPLGDAEGELAELRRLAADPDAELAANSARRAARFGARGAAIATAFLAAAASADGARRLAALELATELSLPLPPALAAAGDSAHEAMLALAGAATGRGGEADAAVTWRRVDAHLAELDGRLLRAVLFASRVRAAWPEPFSRFVAEQTTHVDPVTRRAAYLALATRDPRTDPFAELAEEASYDPAYATWC